ncbi:hypothetical protein RhiJN_28985 [Ceratobasidium sp. AG-Ba]|nr:hypothetical protein RhiJN_28985 [Ceratobasidium sp. AG-Ba]
MVSRLTERVDFVVWQYRNSRRALVALHAAPEVLNWLRPLEPTDLSRLTSMLQGDRSPGEGARQLPWFWHVRSMKIGEWDDSTEENDEVMKVEWFRGKARYERWEEEVRILPREMASVLFSFEQEAKAWMKRRDSVDAAFDKGYHSYCNQQVAMWESLRDDASLQFRPRILAASNTDPTVSRAIARFFA